MTQPLLKLLASLGFLALSFSFALTPVRVLLENELDHIDHYIDGAHQGFVNNGLLFTTNTGLNWPISVQGNELIVEGTTIGRNLRLEPLNNDPIYWEEKPYHGSLELIAIDGNIRAINIIDLEDYLRGVVPAEMQASWHMSALKAQAIAARTYTLASLSPNAAYDVCATTECQVYKGISAEHYLSNQAISETAGMVLTYGDNFAYTYYHADSGGEIASSLEVWGMNLPYLTAKKDYVQNSPNANWTFNLEPYKVQKVIKAYGYDIDRVKSIHILEKSDSGRIEKIEIRGEATTVALEGTVLHKIARDWGLKSTHFELIGGGLRVRGEGWGHGVGMSQYGARTLAEHNYDPEQILEFYYPGTVLRQLQSEEVVLYRAR